MIVVNLPVVDLGKGLYTITVRVNVVDGTARVVRCCVDRPLSEK